jgi:hypothetical protein
MKGVLGTKGEHRRFGFQGVHTLFDAKQERPCGNEQRAIPGSSSAAT